MGVVAVIVFLLLHLAPGDPAALIAGDFATAEDIARIGKQLGQRAIYFDVRKGGEIIDLENLED